MIPTLTTSMEKTAAARGVPKTAEKAALIPVSYTHLDVYKRQEMGSGDPVLGKLLMKGYVFALTQLEVLPQTILLYNSGAYLSIEGADTLEDLKLSLIHILFSGNRKM